MKFYVFPTILAVMLVMAPGATFARSANANPGGVSASHMSPQGAANTNGPNAVDREKGLARAEQRRSASGTAHEKATTHTENNKTNSKNMKKGAATG